MKKINIIFIVFFTLVSCDIRDKKIENSTSHEDIIIDKIKYQNNISEYIYLETVKTADLGDQWILHNKTNYTIDEIVIELSVPNYKTNPTTYLVGKVEKRYLKANSQIKLIYTDFGIPLYSDGFTQLKRGSLKPSIKLIKSRNIDI